MVARKKKSNDPVSLASLFGIKEEVKEEIQEEVIKKCSPFDFINAINFTKENIFNEDVEKQYIPFIINNGLSMSRDTIIYAAEMNSRSHISKKAQFEFLLNTIPKRKRFEKWVKPEHIDNLEVVKGYYGYSDKKAVDALRILTEDQIEYMKKKLSRGGMDVGN